MIWIWIVGALVAACVVSHLMGRRMRRRWLQGYAQPLSTVEYRSLRPELIYGVKPRMHSHAALSRRMRARRGGKNLTLKWKEVRCGQ